MNLVSILLPQTPELLYYLQERRYPENRDQKKYIKAISFILDDFQVLAYVNTTLEILVKMSISEKNIKPPFPIWHTHPVLGIP